MLRRITSGSTISVIAPAFPPQQRKLKKGIKYLEERGYIIKRSASLKGKHNYFSAKDEQRALEINENFADPAVTAIFCARGGWGTLRLLDKLDYEIIRTNPKLILGYSDITSLQLAIWQKCNVPSLSGPMVAMEMGGSFSSFSEEHLWLQINNNQNSYPLNLSGLMQTEILKPGSCSGILLGGCLSLVAHQLGTPYSPDYSNSILFLEDVGEKPYKIDRFLAQLSQAGILDKLAGLIIGEFIDCEEEGSITVKQLFEQYTQDKNYPVIFNFPYGHQADKISMPVGVTARIDTNKNYLAFTNPFK